MSGIIINHDFEALQLREHTHLLKSAVYSRVVPGTGAMTSFQAGYVHEDLGQKRSSW